MRFRIFAVALTTLLFQRTSLAQQDSNSYLQCPPGAEVCLRCVRLEESVQATDHLMDDVTYNVTHDGEGGIKGLAYSAYPISDGTQLGFGAIVAADEASRRPNYFRNFNGIQLEPSTILGFLLDRAPYTNLGIYWCGQNPEACPGGGPADIGRRFYFEALRRMTDENGETHFVDGKLQMCEITLPIYP